MSSGENIEINVQVSVIPKNVSSDEDFEANEARMKELAEVLPTLP